MTGKIATPRLTTLAAEYRQWWVIDVQGKFLGRCFATRDEIRAACGPWHTITGNTVNIFCPPPIGLSWGESPEQVFQVEGGLNTAPAALHQGVMTGDATMSTFGTALRGMFASLWTYGDVSIQRQIAAACTRYKIEPTGIGYVPPRW